MTHSRFLSALALLATIAAAASLSPAVAAAPTVGRYDGQFCVSVAAAAADCGPAQVEVLRPTRLRVRISDIVYHLKLNSSQLEVVLMHGSMQIDEFVAPYDWVGTALQFDDLDKRTRYELRLAEPKAAR
jgi:hypothetical protein